MFWITFALSNIQEERIRSGSNLENKMESRKERNEERATIDKENGKELNSVRFKKRIIDGLDKKDRNNDRKTCWKR